MQSRAYCYRQTCPYCGSGEVHRTVWNGLVERCVLYLWGMGPFRCRRCYKRFYQRMVLENGASPTSTSVS